MPDPKDSPRSGIIQRVLGTSPRLNRHSAHPYHCTSEIDGPAREALVSGLPFAIALGQIVPPGGGATPRECRGVPSLHEIGSATAVPSQIRPTNRGDCHAQCVPRQESPSTAESAILFDQLEVLSGKSRIMRAGPANTNRPRVRQYARALAKILSQPVSSDSSNHNVVRPMIQVQWIAP